MSHECPECGLLCHCNGDVGDLCLNLDESVNRCTHCDDSELERMEWNEAMAEVENDVWNE